MHRHTVRVKRFLKSDSEFMAVKVSEFVNSFKVTFER